MNANCYGTNFQKAKFVNANMDGINLSKANLRDTEITFEQLSYAASLTGTIMPDGSIHR